MGAESIRETLRAVDCGLRKFGVVDNGRLKRVNLHSPALRGLWSIRPKYDPALAGNKTTRNAKPITPEQLTEMVTLKYQGVKYAKIASLTGYSIKTIQKRLRAY